ncbi:MAG: hypothetical protein PHG63_03065 [Candidatus Dojkabacteria bacterium]|nr:hypothetical protein [Candidatus Dojkabacteria bacterium]
MARGQLTMDEAEVRDYANPEAHYRLLDDICNRCLCEDAMGPVCGLVLRETDIATALKTEVPRFHGALREAMNGLPKWLSSLNGALSRGEASFRRNGGNWPMFTITNNHIGTPTVCLSRTTKGEGLDTMTVCGDIPYEQSGMSYLANVEIGIFIPENMNINSGVPGTVMSLHLRFPHMMNSKISLERQRDGTIGVTGQVKTQKDVVTGQSATQIGVRRQIARCYEVIDINMLVDRNGAIVNASPLLVRSR